MITGQQIASLMSIRGKPRFIKSKSLIWTLTFSYVKIGRSRTLSLGSKGCYGNLVALTRLNTCQYSIRFIWIAGVDSPLQCVVVLSVFVIDTVAQETAIDVLERDRIPLYQELIQAMVCQLNICGGSAGN